MAEGDPQKHSPFPDAETDPREAEQTAMALSTVAAEEHAHQLLPRSARRRRLSVQERAGPPKTRLAGRAAETRAGGRGGAHTLPVQRFLHPQLQLLLRRQLGLGKGEKRRERGWVSGAPTTHLIQEPGTCGGHVGRKDRLPRSTTRVWEAWGQLEPRRTVRRGRGHGPDGAEHSQPASTPGLALPAPPGPPCRPTGPSSRALLLAGIRRASSKFLLTLAAPVSLPAAGSVLGGRKGGCHF